MFPNTFQKSQQTLRWTIGILENWTSPSTHGNSSGKEKLSLRKLDQPETHLFLGISDVWLLNLA